LRNSKLLRVSVPVLSEKTCVTWPSWSLSCSERTLQGTFGSSGDDVTWSMSSSASINRRWAKRAISMDT